MMSETSQKPDSKQAGEAPTENSEEKTAETLANGGAAPEAQTAETPKEDQAKGPTPEDLLKEKENQYLYLRADFDNFKKRAAKERMDTLRFGWEPLASELLPVLDNFERALEHSSPENHKALVSGLKMVMKQFQTALENAGLKPVKTSKTFDPNLHEAVAREPSKKPEGEILREEMKGYQLHDRLIRPSRVVVSQGKE